MRLRRLVSVSILIPLAAITWPAASYAQAAAPAAPPPIAKPPLPPPPLAPAALPAPPPPAPPAAPSTFVSPGSDWTFGFHGFAGVSFYVQDTPTFVLNGQGPLLALTKPGGGFTTGADIRQSRFNFSVAGPKVLGGATPKAVLEIDLFGLNSPGGYGEVSVYSRVRLAYAELNWGDDLLRLGQDHNLIFGVVPESIGHLAFPVTYFNGLIGWREPGLGYYHTIPIGNSKLELALQLNKSDWENPTDFGDSTVNDLNVDYGQLSGWVAVEGRVKFSNEHVMAFVSGHYNRVEGTHAGDLVAPPMAGMPAVPAIPTRNWDVIAGVAAFKLTGFGFTFTASAYAGKNLGPLLGDQLQFPVTNDVREWGGWVQAGYEILPGFSVWAIGGTSRPTLSEVAAAGGGRAASSLIGGMVRYRTGGVAFGPEVSHVIAKDIAANGGPVAAGPGAPNGIINANQYMLSGAFFF